MIIYYFYSHRIIVLVTFSLPNILNTCMSNEYVMTNSNVTVDWQSRMLIELERVYDDLGRVPTVTELNEMGAFSGEEYTEEFGSVCQAFNDADIPFRQQRIPTDELIRAIDRLKNRYGQVPKRIDMSEFGDYSGIVYDFRFGSWENALEKAGYEMPDERASDYTRRSVEEGNSIINELDEKFDVGSDVVNEAEDVFLEATKKNILIGNSIKSVAAGSFVVACYANDIGVPTQLIEEYLEIDNATRQYRRLAQKLKLMVLPPDATAYVDSISEAVGITDGKRELVQSAVDQYIEENENTSNSPITTVTSALYAVECLGNKDYTQTEIGGAAGISQVSIRNNYEDFFDYIDRDKVNQL